MTSLSAAVSPVLAEKEMVVPTAVAAVAGSAWRQMVSAPAVVEYELPMKVVLTLVPLGAKPHTVAAAESRCSTMWSPSVLEREKATAEEALGGV